MNVAQQARAQRLLDELRRRHLRELFGQPGWYDEDGVRQGGLIAFVRHFWHILEPETEFVDGWPLWAICEHLEAVTSGQIKRLLVNVSPGSMKSLLTNVFYPAWEWGPMGLAHLRYVTFSYSASLTERDNMRFRDVLSSREYRDLYGTIVDLRNKTTINVMNNKTGWKLASSVGGVATGARGDRLLLDDPHSVKEIESEIVRNEVTRWFRESMSNRLNSLETGAIIIIMQRLHADDVSGIILDLGLPYCHLMIPAEYDWSRQTDQNGDPIKTDIGWFDPRYDERGPEYCDHEFFWPERFPPESFEQTKREMSPYSVSGQYQQSPAPRGGGIFKRAWWQLWDHPEGKFPPLEYIIASLDGAFTSKETSSASALTVWGIFLHKDPEGGPARRRIILLHAWRKFLEFSGPRCDRLEIPTLIDGIEWPSELVDAFTPAPTARSRDESYRRRTMDKWGLVEHTHYACQRFKVDKLLIEAKASGISAAQDIVNRYRDVSWSVEARPVKGDKYARALAVQSTFSQGLVYAPERDWSALVIDEMEQFPRHKFSDLTDSTTQALAYFRGMGLAETDPEQETAEIRTVMHRPQPRSIYPV